MSKLVRYAGVTAVLLLIAAGLTAGQEVHLRARPAIYLDAQGDGIRQPEDVACHGSSTLVVSDTGNRRMLVYEVDGENVQPTAEIRLAQVPYPTSVGIDSAGRILVLDGKSHRIARLTPSGGFQDFVAAPANERQDIGIVKSFAIDRQDNLYLLDVARGKIIVLDSAGGLQREIAFGDEVELLGDLTVAPSGIVFAVDSLKQQVFVARAGDETLTALGEERLADMGLPTAIAADTIGHLFVADGSGHGIVIVRQNGVIQSRQSAMGWKEGFLRHPAGLCVDNGDLWVADRSNNRVQRFAILD